jgi:hypothetical protein
MSFSRIMTDEQGSTYMEEVDVPEDKAPTAEEIADQLMEAKARSRGMFDALNAPPSGTDHAPHPKRQKAGDDKTPEGNDG